LPAPGGGASPTARPGGGDQELPRMPARRRSGCPGQRPAPAAHRSGVLARVSPQRLPAMRVQIVLRIAAMLGPQHRLRGQVWLACRRARSLPCVARAGYHRHPGLLAATIGRDRPVMNRHAGFLLSLVDSLHTRYAWEHSVRFCRGALLPNRFLLTLPRTALERHPADTLPSLWQRLDMP